MEISELQALVEATGLKQVEICERLNVRPEVLNRWLRGRGTPQHPGMVRLALRMLAIDLQKQAKKANSR